jgi:hypothetical protein
VVPRLAMGRPWRQTEGMLRSIIELLGLDLPVPDHTTLARRSARKRACGTCFKSWCGTVFWWGTALLLSHVQIVPNVRNVRRVNAVRQNRQSPCRTPVDQVLA